MHFPFFLENLMFIINDMRNAILNRAQYPRKPGSSLNEKFKSMEKKAFGKYMLPSVLFHIIHHSDGVGVMAINVIDIIGSFNYSFNCT